MTRRQGQSGGRFTRPIYREHEYLPGIHNQAWSPNDEYYVTRQKGGGGSIQFTISSIATAGSTSPYNGLVIATVTVKTASCHLASLIGTQVEVVDHAQCVFDLTEVELSGIWGWAQERVAESRASGASPGDLTPCHWAADDRCCTPGEMGI